MERKIISVCITFLILIILITGCSKEDEEPPVSVSYTVLIYMAADNSMTTEVDYTLEQLKEGMAKSGGTAVVYLDTQDEVPRLFKLTNEGEEVLLKTYGEENSASAATLKQVIEDCKELVPAGQFGLVLWSHANGWLPSDYSFLTKSARTSSNTFPRTRYLGMDEHPGDGTSRTAMMDVAEMAEVLPENMAEFVLFDVCLMANVESLYQLRHICKYMIASPTEVLAEADYDASGMPYSKVLPSLFEGEEGLKKACQAYYNHYKSKSGVLRSATISLTDADELEALYNVTARLLSGKLEKARQLDVTQLQVYHTDNVPQVFFDSGDVVENLCTTDEYQVFKTQLNKTVLYKAATDKFVNLAIDQSHFSGLSMYVPLTKWTEYPEYIYYFATMEWSKVYD